MMYAFVTLSIIVI